MSLMQYIQPSPRQRGEAPQHGADKYHGAISAGYDAKRQGDPKWLLEQYWIETMLEDLPEGSLVLDVPCGTGRFFQFYGSKGFMVKAVDKSGERVLDEYGNPALDEHGNPIYGQLHYAVEKLKALHAQGLVDGHKFQLRKDDIRKLSAPDKCVDAAVVCRLTRWLTPEENVIAFKKLARMVRQRIIWTARIANHQHARTVELFQSALEGWKITRNEVGRDMDYRILEARPIGDRHPI